MKRLSMLLYFIFIYIIPWYLHCTPCSVSYPLPEIPYQSQNPTALAFSPDSKYLAVSNLEGVCIFRFVDGVLSRGLSYHLPSAYDGPVSIAFSPDGRYLITADVSDEITVFKINNGRLSKGADYQLPAQTYSPSSIAFSPDGKAVAIAASPVLLVPAIVTIAEFNNGIVTAMRNYNLPYNSQGADAVAYSLNGSMLAVSNSISDNVVIFQVNNGLLSNGTSCSLSSNATLPNSIAFAPNGKYVATTNQSNNISIVTWNNSTTSYPLPSEAVLPNAGVFSPDGKYFVTANLGKGSGNIAIFSVNNTALSNGVVYALPSGSIEPYAIAFSPDGNYFATANYKSNDVTVFKLACYINIKRG